MWSGTVGAFDKIFVVQTSPRVIERCILMTSDPGDLVFDPTCGSGTTAYVAEQWGRRWITCDTSRVALALARQRLLTASFPFYKPTNPEQGVDGGLDYETVSHVTMKSLLGNISGARNCSPILFILVVQSVQICHVQSQDALN